MSKRCTGVLVATMVLSATTAYAAPAPEPKSPEIARGLTLAAPLGMFLVGAPLVSAMTAASGVSYSSPANSVIQTGFFIMIPASLATGYYYAGDPLRGTLVGLGGVAVTVGPLLAVGAWSGNNPYTGALIGLPLMLVGFLGYTAWAASDVYQTTERLNREAEARARPRERRPAAPSAGPSDTPLDTQPIRPEPSSDKSEW